MRSVVSEPSDAPRCTPGVRSAAVVVGTAMVAAALAAATIAVAKEGASARLTGELPLRAPPATTVRARWRVDVPDGRGGRQPFNAIGMFVRLLSRTGAPSTIGFATSTAHEDGRYAASLRVPAGGIGGVRVGLRGTTDVEFPLANDPFRSRGGARCDVAALRRRLVAFVGAYNRGDLQALDRVFSRERFRWYATSGPGTRQPPESRRRSTLLPYFRARHRRNDRLTLRGYTFNGYERARELGHFEFRAERRADDARAGDWFSISGKGALDCTRPPVTIALMFVGGPGA